MKEPEWNRCKLGVFICVPSTPTEAGEALRGNRTEQFGGHEESDEKQIFIFVKGASIVRGGGGSRSTRSSTLRSICCCSNVTAIRSMDGNVGLGAANGGNGLTVSVEVSCCVEDIKAVRPFPNSSSKHAADTLEEEDRALLRQMKTVIRHGESLVMNGPEEYSIIIPDGWLFEDSGKVTLFGHPVSDVEEGFLLSERAYNLGEGAVDGKEAVEELKKVLNGNDEAEEGGEEEEEGEEG